MLAWFQRFLTYGSAVLALLRPTRCSAPFPRFLVEQQECPLSADCLDAARSTFSIEQDEPLHFLVSGQNNRRILEGAVSHSINGELPPQSILGYSAGAKIGIVSPEISFMQMACLLSRIDAIRYGSALCGRFAVPADTGKLPARKPLTNVHDIRKHLKVSPRMSGRKQASAVLPYIIENTQVRPEK